jgi:hypothetical protein
MLNLYVLDLVEVLRFSELVIICFQKQLSLPFIMHLCLHIWRIVLQHGEMLVLFMLTHSCAAKKSYTFSFQCRQIGSHCTTC